MRAKPHIKLTQVGIATAYADETPYPIADDVQVYLRSGQQYYLSSLSDVTGGRCTLTGYYDNISGKLRVIVAE